MFQATKEELESMAVVKMEAPLPPPDQFLFDLSQVGIFNKVLKFKAVSLEVENGSQTLIRK